MRKKASIVIDIQNGYFENGAIPLVNPVQTFANADATYLLFSVLFVYRQNYAKFLSMKAIGLPK